MKKQHADVSVVMDVSFSRYSKSRKSAFRSLKIMSLIYVVLIIMDVIQKISAAKNMVSLLRQTNSKSTSGSRFNSH